MIATLLRPLRMGTMKSSARFSYLTVAAVAVLLFLAISVYLFPTGFSEHRPADWGVLQEPPGDHPIDNLVADANDQWRQLLARETHDLANASTRYRQLRGRHPPPGFDQWFAFAQSKDAVLVEEFFDQIYHDLSPYWGIAPDVLRQQARGQEPRIYIRSHQATPVGRAGPHWEDAWHEMIAGIEKYLPDLDMPLNGMDEPRILTPWEKITEYVQRDHAQRQFLNRSTAVSEYMTLPHPDDDDAEPFVGPFGNTGVWNMARAGCPPDSPARNSDMPHMDFAHPPPEFDNYLHLSEEGYLKNWTLSKDPCYRPELQSLHGSFIEPITVATSPELIPLFGGSKLPINNGILIPPAMYWADDPLYSGGKDHGGDWASKKDVFFWRGLASGGRNREDTWTGFQRHRFLSMLNGTQVAAAEADDGHFVDFRLPNYDYYRLEAGRAGKLPEFLNNATDVAFTGLACFPNTREPFCDYTDEYFHLQPLMPMKDMYPHKYLPDIDGNSFSGRYRAFLLSTSLPIKAALYNEWHDSRIIPWAHFVPMDTTYMDIYGIMEYFLGFEGRGAHDSMAKKIALDGKSWAEKVLRKEDMQIYVYRLLLEYARISDDRRELLAFVDDLQ